MKGSYLPQLIKGKNCGIKKGRNESFDPFMKKNLFQIFEVVIAYYFKIMIVD